MFTTIMSRNIRASLTASLHGKSARLVVLLTTLVITSVTVNSLLILADSHLR